MIATDSPDTAVRSGGRGPGRARQIGAAGAAVSGAGAALVATAATACCAGPVVAPLIVAVLGASGAAWAAGLKALQPVAAGRLVLPVGIWLLVRLPRAQGL